MLVALATIELHLGTAQAAIDAIASCADVEARTHALDLIGAYVVQQMEASAHDLALLHALNEVAKR